jgi:hypothetical protein
MQIFRAMALAGVVGVSGCASTVVQEDSYQSFHFGQQLRAAVGDVLLEAHQGQISKVKHWVGILYSPDGWKTDTVYSDDFISKQLIYSGISGNTIKLTYREFRCGLAAQAFYQTVEYDLSKSSEVVFQNFAFSVSHADNSLMTAVLIRA